MSIIDWSDPDEMVGLLCDYVRDEMHETYDRPRGHFLHELAVELEFLVSGSARDTECRLREICEAQPPEFRNDPAMRHLEDCVAELHRISAQASRNQWRHGLKNL